MANALAALLPSSPLLSTDTANSWVPAVVGTIEAILADIPLFCEGIMGIGVFTFLFLTKQVKLVSVFLYAATFMAFVAATLDLGQVLTRGPQNTAKGIGLESVTALIYAREISLSISIFFLDLFFWVLVARCPRGECVDKPSELSTKRTGAPRPHSGSWNRWGLMGTILKWSTLAALIAVPLLQMVWRLIPNQRRYSSIYVAESTIQTSVTAIFILKFILNITISPLVNWWRALQLYSVPIAALVIGTGLGVGNVAVFAFTETALGRFLRAVEVYLLILHSLYTAFQDFSENFRKGNTEEAQQLSEKAAEFNYVGSLPITYAPTRTSKLIPDNLFSRLSSQPRRASTISWVIPSPPERISPRPYRISAGDGSTVLARYTPPPAQNTSPVNETPRVSPSQPGYASSGQQDNGLKANERPVTSVSLSYYTTEQNFVVANQDDFAPPNALRDMAASSSQQGSITSLDELLRQQTELDNSIAALRLNSTLISNGPRFEDKQGLPDSTADQSRTTLTSTKSSEFSLSVFPDPPTVRKDDTATKYTSESSWQTRSQDLGNGKQNAGPSDNIQGQSLNVPNTARKSLLTPSSQQAQFDVTSFIGDLSDSSRNSLDGDDEEEEITETPAAPTQGAGLRPMILPLRISTTQREDSGASPTSPPRSYDNERGSMSTPTSLRPLLLTQPSSSRMMPLQSVTMVPLAQRRQRGGTISSNTRRPVIGLPQMNEVLEEGNFERPRAAPSVLQQPRTL